MATQAQRDAILAQLDAIEAEMKRIGFWRENREGPPPDGPLAAPGFEAWLQEVFLPNARAACVDDALPERSQVGVLALRQYDYHSRFPEADGLVTLLNDFDRMVEAATRKPRTRRPRRPKAE